MYSHMLFKGLCFTEIVKVSYLNTFYLTNKVDFKVHTLLLKWQFFSDVKNETNMNHVRIPTYKLRGKPIRIILGRKKIKNVTWYQRLDNIQLENQCDIIVVQYNSSVLSISGAVTLLRIGVPLKLMGRPGPVIYGRYGCVQPVSQS